MSDCCSVKDSKTPAPPSVLACPVSGRRSKQVDGITLKSLVRHLPFGMSSGRYYFCDDSACDVVYFSADPAAPVFRRADLMVQVGVKEKDDPIQVCYCFGITTEDIRDEIRKTGKSTIAKRIRAEVKAGRCACEVKNPSGKCCLGEVMRAVQDGLRNAPAT
jgi:hypothetical protein